MTHEASARDRSTPVEPAEFDRAIRCCSILGPPLRLRGLLKLCSKPGNMILPDVFGLGLSAVTVEPSAATYRGFSAACCCLRPSAKGRDFASLVHYPHRGRLLSSDLLLAQQQCPPPCVLIDRRSHHRRKAGSCCSSPSSSKLPPSLRSSLSLSNLPFYLRISFGDMGSVFLFELKSPAIEHACNFSLFAARMVAAGMEDFFAQIEL